MRWLWIDRFTEFQPRQYAVAVKNLSHAEDHFADHFPGFPVMPAPLMIEGLAQTGGILVGQANDFRENVILAKVPKAKFAREVFPGEQLTYRTDILDLRAEGALVSGTVSVGEERIGEAEIFFAHVSADQARELFGETNFVFDGNLKAILGLPTLTGQQ
ncbi:MAG: 3-hydroxyacyl-ACP dehydratase FabZ family protein [Gemmataceae bacterium]